MTNKARDAYTSSPFWDGEFFDMRSAKIHARLSIYYLEVSGKVAPATAHKAWKQFKQWCIDNGYSQQEINHVKRNYAEPEEV